MTTRTMGGMAAALLAAAGLCRGAASDNQNQVVPAKTGAAAATAPTESDWETIAASFGGSKADTKPSEDVTMQFTFSAEVREINALGGQSVQKGKILMRARDAEVVAAIDRQRDKSSNETEIKGAEQNLRTAEFKFNMLEKSGTFSPTEFEDAKNAAVVARLQLEQARNNKKQEELGLKQTEAQYQRYWLEAPFDGIIEEVMVEVGEGVTEQTKVLRMVNTAKMRLDPYADTRETIRLGLKKDSPAWVLIDMPDAPKLVQGKVLYVSPVADSVSQTRRVRVEIENPQHWPAGTQAKVRFVEPGGEWEKYRTTDQQRSFDDFIQNGGAVGSASGLIPNDASNKAGVAASEVPLPILVQMLVDEIQKGNCVNECVACLLQWLDHGYADTNGGCADPIVVRATVAEMLNDAETRSSLLAGGDAGHDGRFFIAGDGFPPGTSNIYDSARRIFRPMSGSDSEGTPK